MNRQEKPSRSCSSWNKLEHGGLHRDVQRGGGLVGDQQFGIQRERAGDADALPLTARQLVRKAVDPVARGSSTCPAASPTRLRDLGACADR